MDKDEKDLEGEIKTYYRNLKIIFKTHLQLISSCDRYFQITVSWRKVFGSKAIGMIYPSVSKERGDQGVQESTEWLEKFSRVWKGYEV